MIVIEFRIVLANFNKSPDFLGNVGFQVQSIAEGARATIPLCGVGDEILLKKTSINKNLYQVVKSKQLTVAIIILDTPEVSSPLISK